MALSMAHGVNSTGIQAVMISPHVIENIIFQAERVLACFFSLRSPHYISARGRVFFPTASASGCAADPRICILYWK